MGVHPFILTPMDPSADGARTSQRRREKRVFHAKQERKELLARVRVVLEASGCDVDKARKAGKNMVFVAAECGNVEALEMLVSAGAKIDAPATNGETPTHVARARGHAAAHAWLVARGGVATAPAKKKSSFSFSPKKLSPKKSPSK